MTTSIILNNLHPITEEEIAVCIQDIFRTIDQDETIIGHIFTFSNQFISISENTLKYNVSQEIAEIAELIAGHQEEDENDFFKSLNKDTQLKNAVINYVFKNIYKQFSQLQETITGYENLERYLVNFIRDNTSPNACVLNSIALDCKIKFKSVDGDRTVFKITPKLVIKGDEYT